MPPIIIPGEVIIKMYCFLCFNNNSFNAITVIENAVLDNKHTVYWSECNGKYRSSFIGVNVMVNIDLHF